MNMKIVKEGKQMKKLDIILEVVFVIAIVVLMFFFHCVLDWYMTILAAVVAIGAGIAIYKQHKKLKELENAKDQ